jgi:hypothetical protein
VLGLPDEGPRPPAGKHRPQRTQAKGGLQEKSTGRGKEKKGEAREGADSLKEQRERAGGEEARQQGCESKAKGKCKKRRKRKKAVSRAEQEEGVEEVYQPRLEEDWL